MNKQALRKIFAILKIEARKNIGNWELMLDDPNTGSDDKKAFLAAIKSEREMMSKEPNIKTVGEALDLIHTWKHSDTDKCYVCDLYKAALEEPDRKPRFGNLIELLQQEVDAEKSNVETKHLPSQNDLTRWALKSAVLEFYKNMNMPNDVVVVETQYDDRLVPQFAPDFDVIYRMWMEKLDLLQHRNDKYQVEPEEYDKAEGDLEGGMRGSAFEKQLDRFRDEFMNKLKR